MQLDPDSIHIWSAEQSEFGLQQLQTHCLRWLDADYLRRLRRLRTERHQLQLLLGHFLVRSVLSQYHNEVAPADWCFVKNAYGKPALDQDRHALKLFFNLSHSRGRLVVAVARGDCLGVDIEACSRPRRIARIASRFFAPQEVQDMLALPTEKQNERFYQLWTLKEAYIKARGLGLAIPLQQFSFSFHNNNCIKVAFDEQLEDLPEHWRFWQMNVEDGYKLALAIRREADQPSIDVQMHAFTSALLLSAANQ